MKPLPTKFDPRSQSASRILDQLHRDHPISVASTDDVAAVLSWNRDLKALEQLSTLLPARGGMKYDEASLAHRSQRRMNKAIQVAGQVSGGSFHTVLDIGCGRGDNLRGLQQRESYCYVGLDIDDRRFPATRSLQDAEHSEQFICASAECIPLPTGSVDLVVSFNVLEHLPQPGAVIHEITRVLRNGGVFFTQFGPPWNAPFGPHLTRFSGVPHLHHLFPDDVVARFTKREDAYCTVNRLPLKVYRQHLWNTPSTDCRYYWEHVTYDHVWAWPHFLETHRPTDQSECIVNRVDAALVKTGI
ncbi:class I SAM-dependent methyltransferase [Methylibium sp. Root1272]|uniref:class I SAM-dependent methyltransferase n=1 Tax=Methylibium sp. Root1272 TaxID=1736441 RepID=UPI0012E77F0F|nr:class I SAM-dependent methyltransferase [Methylibium sp. Root1272]